MNYSYLADGTKVRAVDADGEGLEYRGSLTFRRSSDGTLTPESIAFPGGRFVAMQGAEGNIQMVPNYHISDHLGSVRTIVNGSTGQVVETNDYYAFGSRWDRSGSIIDQSNRYRFNGKEEQVTGNIGLTDYGARFYDSSVIRWTTPDPLAEKYYSTSPYAFCNNNPVNFVDPDGQAVETLLDIAIIGMGVRSFVKNIKSGNLRGAVGDAVGIAVDAVAAAVPFVPGGVGAVRAGAKAVNAIDNAADVAKGVGNVADNATDAAKTAASFVDGKTYVTYTKVNPKTGEVYSGRASEYGPPKRWLQIEIEIII